MASDNRRTGLDIIGNVPWGTHFCQFYQTKEDLIDILVPYFQAGLEDNEFCMWITSEPLEVEEAKASLRKKVRNLDDYIKKGQIEILDYSEWYTKSGKFESDKVLQGWVEKEKLALEKGFEGLRLTGNTFWLEPKDWKDFTDYEATVNGVIGKYRMLAVCSYSLEKCGATEVIDVVSNHQFALIRRDDRWQIIEDTERKQAEETLKESEAQYSALVETSPDGIIMMQDGVVKFANTTSLELVGYRLEELIGVDFLNIVSPGNRKMVMKKFADRVAGKEAPSIYEITLIKKDGTTLPVEVNATLTNYEGRTAVLVFIRDITERKRAEEALRKSQESAQFLANVLESSSQPFAVGYPDGRLRTFNTAYCELLGYSREELHELKWDAELTPPEWQKVVAKAAEEIIRTRQPRRFEKEYIRKDGSRVPVEVFANPIFDTKGDLEYFFSFFTDITERKQAEEALKESENKYRSLVNNVKLGVFRSTPGPAGRFLEVNPAMEEITGYRRKELLQMNVTDLYVHPEGREKILEEIASGKGRVVKKLRFRKKDGTEIMVSDRKVAVRDDAGNILYFDGIMEDITEHKRAEEALQKSEQNFRNSLDNSPLGIRIIATEGELLYANQAILDMYDYSSFEELKNTPTKQRYTPESYAAHRERVRNRKLGKPCPDEYEIGIVRKDGEVRYLAAYCREIIWNDEPQFQTLYQDITERKQVEEEERELEVLKKLDQARCELLSCVSHELRTPLASIKGYCTMLMDYDQRLGHKEKQESLQIIDKASDRLTELIDHLLDMSRLDAGLLRMERKPTSISNLIRETIAEAKMRAPEHKIVLNIRRGLSMVNIDDRRIRQVLDNILDNAVKYSEKGTEVVVQAETKAQELEISVADQGVGIPAVDIDRVFDRMYRIEQRLVQDPGGLGLGLSLCKGLVEAHNGRIWMESEEGKGSKCSFTLPL